MESDGVSVQVGLSETSLTCSAHLIEAAHAASLSHIGRCALRRRRFPFALRVLVRHRGAEAERRSHPDPSSHPVQLLHGSAQETLCSPNAADTSATRELRVPRRCLQRRPCRRRERIRPAQCRLRRERSCNKSVGGSSASGVIRSNSGGGVGRGSGILSVAEGILRPSSARAVVLSGVAVVLREGAAWVAPRQIHLQVSQPEHGSPAPSSHSEPHRLNILHQNFMLKKHIDTCCFDSQLPGPPGDWKNSSTLDDWTSNDSIWCVTLRRDRKRSAAISLG